MDNALATGLKEASNLTYTENGRLAYKTSNYFPLDFFSRAASLRMKNTNVKALTKNDRKYRYLTVSNEAAFEGSRMRKLAIKFFNRAFEENKILAVLILFWLRDARGGAGERQIFRSIYKAGMANPDCAPVLRAVAKFIPEYGRWDDIWSCVDPFDPQNADLLAEILKQGLANPETSHLLAKWLPRENKKDVRLVRQIATLMGYGSLKEYRKDIASKSQTVVERKMSSNAWDEIIFKQVPSLAVLRYTNAFTNKAGENFSAYKEQLARGEAKINASVLYPYEIIRHLKISEEIAEAAWKALPNYIPENLRIFPIVDVSGSMSFQISRGVTGTDVAVSLGMYCAEHQTGPFKNLFMTFSEKPRVLNIEDMGNTLKSKMEGMERADWGYNTNIDAAMRMLLNIAVKTKCSNDDLPDILYILSDMQFDDCVTNAKARNTFLEDTRVAFANAGYKMPHVVFHNLNGTYGNLPAQKQTRNVSMVTGFSPAIIKHILAGEEVSPETQMLEVLYSDRYTPIRLKLESIVKEERLPLTG